MFRLFATATALLLGACSNVPVTPQTIRGSYELKEGRWYAGESVRLRHDTFEYVIFTDVVDDPRHSKFPVRGRYSLYGSSIIFHHPAVPSPKRILTQRFGRFVMWTPQQRQQYLRTRRTPGDLLYQNP